ncbi:hypothetical protein I309_04597 [Cryptococcus deuterogattii LA55]|nr:hypothetical protein I309_04597 [Cryptococcus deuterogattii LA55]KIR35985.1 hypothetical protein I352_00927 [Cryptococcus deuterogattii MMRL2647]KIR95359.1 hypothetical protein I304_00108 [Cryptococcus deuterogattii CBS 10090]
MDHPRRFRARYKPIFTFHRYRLRRCRFPATFPGRLVDHWWIRSFPLGRPPLAKPIQLPRLPDPHDSSPSDLVEQCTPHRLFTRFRYLAQCARRSL